jgi:hypothetical protein
MIMEGEHKSEFPKMEQGIPIYGIQIGWFTALSDVNRRLDTIAFGIYRRLSPPSGKFWR